MTSKNLVALVGGGSGGHLTPLIPVAEKLKLKRADVRIVHIGQKGDPLNSITKNADVIDEQLLVAAGKYRRYHGENWLVRLVDIRTFFFNVRDFFQFITGIFQAWFLLGKLKPRVILMKGGYVCAPVGIAAGLRGIPYVTHDSDAMVSLAHRIIAKKATFHLTAMDPELYLPQYSIDKTRQVGVPVRADYTFVTKEDQARARKKLGMSNDEKVLLVVGGGLGARNINNAIIQNMNKLLAHKVTIVMITGHKLFAEVERSLGSLGLQENERERIKTIAFSDELHTLSAAADVVITRAGATNMAEFAAQGKACIVVPSPFLAGGHQLKNAQALEKTRATIVVDESNISTLAEIATMLLDDPKQQAELSKNLHAIAHEDAAEKIADTLLQIINESA
ncbi:glycosyltransferase [Candidatus Saccharibacteria bacterium]|nr:glycosyltransferase [Candidatus Saccharibacteria bacterium]